MKHVCICVYSSEIGECCVTLYGGSLYEWRHVECMLAELCY